MTTTVTFKNQTYTIDGEGYPTCAVFAHSIHSAADGETYTDQWQDRGTDSHGNRVIITWEWEMVRGEEPEDGGDYPWYDSNIVRVERV